MAYVLRVWDEATQQYQAVETFTNTAKETEVLKKVSQTLTESEIEQVKTNLNLTDEQITTIAQLVADKYLPLEGGTMTGKIASPNPAMASKASENYLRLVAGDHATGTWGSSGAELILRRNDKGTDNDGLFTLVASDGTTTTQLVGTPSGMLTWTGSIKGQRLAAYNGVNNNVDFLINGITSGGFYLPGSLAANSEWYPVIIGGVTNTSAITTSSWSYAAGFKATSDINKKSDLIPINPDLSSLKAYTYTLKNDGQKHTGLIAQEVEKVIPYAVSEIEDGTKVLDYNAVVAALVSEVNSLKKRIEELEKSK